ncbi:MAG: exported protein of unknown function [Myxococcales bacterium]|nr:exported protein of unknown function [Myxococcales bacterium]
MARVLVLGWVLFTLGCTRHNPDACCSTIDECNAVGLTEIGGCAVDKVCYAGSCVAPQCTGSADCMSPTPDCVDGICIQAPDAAVPRVAYVAFATDRDGNFEIYRMNPDGTSRTNLTSNPASDTAPIWDPTGDHIAFLSDRTGSIDVYVMTVDGANVINVSQGGKVTDIAWAPDSAHLLFTSNRSGTNQIYRVRSDGSELTPLTTLAGGAMSPDWSPDGMHIAFISGNKIYVMNADGSSPTAITTGVDFFVKWRPDGSRIAFPHRITFQNDNIFVANPDGGSAINVTNTAGAVEVNGWSWSPDGNYLAGTGGLDPDTEITVAKADGSSVTNVSMSSSSRDGSPCWSADSSMLIYSSDRSGNSDLYKVARVGGMSVNLTNSAGNDGGCAWRPR